MARTSFFLRDDDVRCILDQQVYCVLMPPSTIFQLPGKSLRPVLLVEEIEENH